VAVVFAHRGVRFEGRNWTAMSGRARLRLVMTATTSMTAKHMGTSTMPTRRESPGTGVAVV